MAMSEDEYYAGENEPDDENDDDILGEYLIEEVDDDITFISMPKITFDYDVEYESYYKILRKCKTKEDMKNSLRAIISHSNGIAVLQHEINFLQERAKDLEFNIQIMQSGNE